MLGPLLLAALGWFDGKIAVFSGGSSAVAGPYLRQVSLPKGKPEAVDILLPYGLEPEEAGLLEEVIENSDIHASTKANASDGNETTAVSAPRKFRWRVAPPATKAAATVTEESPSYRDRGPCFPGKCGSLGHAVGYALNRLARSDIEGLTAQAAEVFWILAYLRLGATLLMHTPRTWPFSWQSLACFWVVHLTRLPIPGLKVSRWNELGGAADLIVFLVSSLVTVAVLCWRWIAANDMDIENEAKGRERAFGSGLVPVLGGIWLAKRARLSFILGRAGTVLAFPTLITALGLLIHFWTPGDVLADDLLEGLSPLGASLHMAADSLALLPQLVFLARVASTTRQYQIAVKEAAHDSGRFVDPELAVPWLLWMMAARASAFVSGVAAVLAEAHVHWNLVEVFYTTEQLLNVLLLSDTFLHLTKVAVLGDENVRLFQI